MKLTKIEVQRKWYGLVLTLLLSKSCLVCRSLFLTLKWERKINSSILIKDSGLWRLFGFCWFSLDFTEIKL